MNIHRKGATPAYTGQITLIPGSMGDHSYVAVGKGNEEWLWSCSHGAGRAERRQNMRNKKVEFEKTTFYHGNALLSKKSGYAKKRL
ncbi:hypothetical protein A9G37_10505 [Gilliamella sp. GillExp13]|nr:RtcB family protein [Gilliamella apicola]OCG62530.1 hypothetical protein A9G37_10505 [Gilliamella apicola]